MEVYLIVQSSGDYDSQNENILATLDPKQANKIVKKLNELVAFNADFNERRNDFSSEYAKQYPDPERPVYPDELKRLVAISKEHKTEKDRRDFKKVNGDWENAIKEYQNKQLGHNKQFRLDTLVWVDKNYNLPDHLKKICGVCKINDPSSIGGNYKFDVEEIDLLTIWE